MTVKIVEGGKALFLRRSIRWVHLLAVSWVLGGITIISPALASVETRRAVFSSDTQSLINESVDSTRRLEAEAHRPPSWDLHLEEPFLIALPKLKSDEVRELESKGRRGNGTDNQMNIVGVGRWLPKNIHKYGGLLWRDTPRGYVWRLQITSRGSKGISVRFKKFNVGKGQVWLYNAGGQVEGPYTSKGVHQDGEFWSADVAGDTLTIEYWPVEQTVQKQRVPFRVVRLSHLLID